MESDLLRSHAFVVTIYGPTGSGKSTVAKALVAELGENRCVRVPGDVFLVPAECSLEAYHQMPHTYDWKLMRSVLSTLDGRVVGTPEFDFKTFKRISDDGGREITMRAVRVIDALRAYPHADLSVHLTTSAEVRKARIIERDQQWNSRVIDRWEQLEATRLLSESQDAGHLHLSGLDDPAISARKIADKVQACIHKVHS